MRFFKKIEENESWSAAFIGYRLIEYRSLDGLALSKSIRIAVYLGFLLIKVEFIPLK